MEAMEEVSEFDEYMHQAVSLLDAAPSRPTTFLNEAPCHAA